MADLNLFGPTLAYDDINDTILNGAQFFMYATYDDALADQNRLAVYDENGIPVEVLRSTAKGVVTRWRSAVMQGYIRAGDNIEAVYSGEGLTREVRALQSRVTTVEGALAMLDIAPDGVLRSDDFDFVVDPTRANALLLYADEDKGDDIEIVVDPTRPNSLLIYER